MKTMVGRPGVHLLSCLILVMVLVGSACGEADIASRLKGMKTRHKELSEKRRNTVDSFRGKEVNFVTTREEVGETEEEHAEGEDPENVKLGFRESLKALREEFSSELGKVGGEENLIEMQNVGFRPNADLPLLSSVMEARIERKMLKMFENFLATYESKKCAACNQADQGEPEAPVEVEDEDTVKATKSKLRRKLKKVIPPPEPETEPEPEEGDRIAMAIEARKKLKEAAKKKLIPEESETGTDTDVDTTTADALEQSDTEAAAEAETDDNLEELGELPKDAFNLKDLSVEKLKQMFNEGASGHTLASIKKGIINKWRGVIGVSK